MITLVQNKPTENFTLIRNDLLFNNNINIYALKYSLIIISCSCAFLESLTVPALQQIAGFKRAAHQQAVDFFLNNGFLKIETPFRNGRFEGKIYKFDLTDLQYFGITENQQFRKLPQNSQKNDANSHAEKQQYKYPKLTLQNPPKPFAGVVVEMVDQMIENALSTSAYPKHAWLLQVEILKCDPKIKNLQAVLAKRLMDDNCLEGWSAYQLVHKNSFENHNSSEFERQKIDDCNAHRARELSPPDPSFFEAGRQFGVGPFGKSKNA